MRKPTTVHAWKAWVVPKILLYQIYNRVCKLPRWWSAWDNLRPGWQTVFTVWGNTGRSTSHEVSAWEQKHLSVTERSKASKINIPMLFVLHPWHTNRLHYIDFGCIFLCFARKIETITELSSACYTLQRHFAWCREIPGLAFKQQNSASANLLIRCLYLYLFRDIKFKPGSLVWVVWDLESTAAAHSALLRKYFQWYVHLAPRRTEICSLWKRKRDLQRNSSGHDSWLYQRPIEQLRCINIVQVTFISHLRFKSGHLPGAREA